MAFGRKTEDQPRPAGGAREGDSPGGFLPQRGRRRGVESVFMRVIATGGIIGLGTALAAILGSQEVDAWIIGIAVSALTVILAAFLWSARTL